MIHRARLRGICMALISLSAISLLTTGQASASGAQPIAAAPFRADPIGGVMVVEEEFASGVVGRGFWNSTTLTLQPVTQRIEGGGERVDFRLLEMVTAGRGLPVQVMVPSNPNEDLLLSLERDVSSGSASWPDMGTVPTLFDDLHELVPQPASRFTPGEAVWSAPAPLPPRALEGFSTDVPEAKFRRSVIPFAYRDIVVAEGLIERITLLTPRGDVLQLRLRTVGVMEAGTRRPLWAGLRYEGWRMPVGSAERVPVQGRRVITMRDEFTAMPLLPQPFIARHVPGWEEFVPALPDSIATTILDPTAAQPPEWVTDLHAAVGSLDASLTAVASEGRNWLPVAIGVARIAISGARAAAPVLSRAITGLRSGAAATGQAVQGATRQAAAAAGRTLQRVGSTVSAAGRAAQPAVAATARGLSTAVTVDGAINVGANTGSLIVAAATGTRSQEIPSLGHQAIRALGGPEWAARGYDIASAGKTIVTARGRLREVADPNNYSFLSTTSGAVLLGLEFAFTGVTVVEEATFAPRSLTNSMRNALGAVNPGTKAGTAPSGSARPAVRQATTIPSGNVPIAAVPTRLALPPGAIPASAGISPPRAGAATTVARTVAGVGPLPPTQPPALGAQPGFALAQWVPNVGQRGIAEDLEVILRRNPLEGIPQGFRTGGFITGAFQLPVFRTPTSTGGLFDIIVTLGQEPFRFRVFDSGNLQDGDRVSLQVRSRSGLNLAPTNITLTFAGQVFSVPVTPGPVEVGLTALNVGTSPPNTGGLRILSPIDSGPANQNFNLNEGQTGILRVIAR